MSKLTYTKYLGSINCYKLLQLRLHFLFCASLFGLCIQVQAEQSSQKQQTEGVWLPSDRQLGEARRQLGEAVCEHGSLTAHFFVMFFVLSATNPRPQPTYLLYSFCQHFVFSIWPFSQNLLSHVFSTKICSKVDIFSLYSYVLSPLIFLPFKSALYCDEKLHPVRNYSSIQWMQKAQFRGVELGRD